MSAMRVLAGKALSYSNIADIDAAYGVVSDLMSLCLCRQANTPCGVALARRSMRPIRLHAGIRVDSRHRRL